MIGSDIREQFRMFIENDHANSSVRLQPLAAFIAHNDDLTGRSNMQGHVVGSGIVTDGTSVLLIKHQKLGLWLQPGGHLKEQESPEGGARREISEETGILAALSDWHLQHPYPIDIDIHLIPVNLSANEAAHLHFDFRYLFSHRAAPIRKAVAEVSDYGWFPTGKAIELAPGLSRALSNAKHFGLIA